VTVSQGSPEAGQLLAVPTRLPSQRPSNKRQWAVKVISFREEELHGHQQ
jgi:hypothetical protein